MQIIDYWQMLNDEANVYAMVHDIVERYLLLISGISQPDTEEGKFEQK
jgi:hypothetical protein